ncbi:MAG TPA: hypothetical protein DCZ95_10310 [Verrucomicrobia bacterium]|nr:MAG: hypothetical protein A2X46_18835 [Lentisphaerae bacterium GWF2_57_35]HBA84475.1 hypothetical protein [Verrucomicrobiota bacterium]
MSEQSHCVLLTRIVKVGLPKLMGIVDIHLLASSLLAGIPLWTTDKALRSAAVKMAIAKD